MLATVQVKFWKIIAPEEFTAAVDQRLRSGYGVGVSDLLADNFARAAQRAGWTPAEFVLWLAEIEDLTPRPE